MYNRIYERTLGTIGCTSKKDDSVSLAIGKISINHWSSLAFDKQYKNESYKKAFCRRNNSLYASRAIKSHA